MKRIFLNCLLMVIAATLSGQSPVVRTYAYSRATIPGIRQETMTMGDSVARQNNNPFPVIYFLYIEVRKGSSIKVNGVWLDGEFHGAILSKVNSPILVDSDPGVNTGQKDTLVKKTVNDVYAVAIGEVKSGRLPSASEKTSIRGNPVVVSLQYNNSTCVGTASKITPLHPMAAM